MQDTVTRTDVDGRRVVERRHISFSALDKFAGCPRKFHAYDVTKTVKEPENPAMQEGFRVHKALAEYITDGTTLPPEYEQYRKWPDRLLEEPMDEILTEHRLAMTFDMRPCEYFSRKEKVWLRAQADLLAIAGNNALNVDWKTGKEKDPQYEVLPPNFQLRIASMLIFLHFPHITHITNKYVYLNEGTSTTFEMPRTDLRDFVRQFYDIAAGLQKAVRNEVWPPRPSGLCKRFCAVTTCEYHGRGNSL